MGKGSSTLRSGKLFIENQGELSLLWEEAVDYGVSQADAFCYCTGHVRGGTFLDFHLVQNGFSRLSIVCQLGDVILVAPTSVNWL